MLHLNTCLAYLHKSWRSVNVQKVNSTIRTLLATSFGNLKITDWRVLYEIVSPKTTMQIRYEGSRGLFVGPFLLLLGGSGFWLSIGSFCGVHSVLAQPPCARTQGINLHKSIFDESIHVFVLLMTCSSYKLCIPVNNYYSFKSDG
jgi:hypothetical protein